MRSLHVGALLALYTFRRGQKGLLITPILVMVVTYINLLFIPGMVRGAIVANKQKLRETMVADYAIQPAVNSTDIPGVASKVAAIEQLDGVEAVTPVLQVGNRITRAESGGYWTVLAVDPVSYAAVFNNRIEQGAFLSGGGDGTVIVGSRIAGSDAEASDSSLGNVPLGTELSILLYNAGEHTYTVNGIFNNSFYDADIRAFIDRAAYDELVPDTKDVATSMFIKTQDGSLPAASLTELKTILGDATVRHADENSANFEEQAATYRDIGQVIGVMAVFVASIVIFIVTYIDLLQRRHQIGIQRAIGIRPSSIIISYTLRAFISTVLGIIIGALLYKFMIVEYFNRYPFELRNGEVSLVTPMSQYISYGIFLLVVAVLAALMPALREVRIKLLAAIWGQT